jgi:phosphatidate cytidylyltransferase
MLAQRLITIAVLIPIVAAATFLGGWVFTLMIALVMAISIWEFWQIFKNGDFMPALPVMLPAVLALVIFRHVFAMVHSDLILAVFVLSAMTYHIFAYSKGHKNAGTDFCISLAGVLYIGWMGAYLISIRNLSEGAYWLLFVLGAIWLADGGAYIFGVNFGKHQMAPHVSPKKTWEGYLGGVLTSVIGMALLSLALGSHLVELTPLRGAIFGLVIAAISPLGDLGESLIKRQFDVKDSSHLLPGHGGFLDRMDTILWGAAIGYYLILFFS